MPITKSAKKASKQTIRRTWVNKRRKDAVRKAARELKTSTNPQSALSMAYKAIDKATKLGIMKPNTAARKKSRLSRLSLKLKT